MTCHNRREKTLACLTSLFNSYDNESTRDALEIQCFLVDDGSSDGTAEAISKNFPQVIVITGDGSLFWNQGMRLAWNVALEEKFDYYLWLNDDSILYADALIRIVNTYKKLIKENQSPGAIVGTLISAKSNEATYGGRLRNSSINPLSFGEVIPPSLTPVKCHAINGNFTLIPARSVEKIGLLSPHFSHSMGDFDYGLRLQNASLSCWVAEGIYGVCERNTRQRGCTDANISIKERLVLMNNLSQLPPVNEWKYFVRTHGGSLWPLFWIKAWFREKFPKLWVVVRSKKI